MIGAAHIPAFVRDDGVQPVLCVAMMLGGQTRIVKKLLTPTAATRLIADLSHCLLRHGPSPDSPAAFLLAPEPEPRDDAGELV